MKIEGKVVEVFLPLGEETTKIGFKIQVDNKVITIITEQDNNLSKIYRDDVVGIIVHQESISSEITYTIERLNVGEGHE